MPVFAARSVRRFPVPVYKMTSISPSQASTSARNRHHPVLHDSRSSIAILITDTAEEHSSTVYPRVVWGEPLAGINMFENVGAGFRNLVGGRSRSYEGEVTRAWETTLAVMMVSASGTTMTLSASP